MVGVKHGCFKCGEIDGNVFEGELGELRCFVCGSHSIVDPITALDILIEINQKNGMPDILEDFLLEADVDPDIYDY